MTKYGNALLDSQPQCPKHPSQNSKRCDLSFFLFAYTHFVQFMDKKLFVHLQGGRKVSGVLRGYDLFLNLVIDDAMEESTPAQKHPIGTVVCPSLHVWYIPTHKYAGDPWKQYIIDNFQKAVLINFRRLALFSRNQPCLIHYFSFEAMVLNKYLSKNGKTSVKILPSKPSSMLT